MALRVEVVYALPEGEDASFVQLAAGSTALDAARASGILERHALEPRDLKLGIYGKPVAADAPLAEGDRVEIYRRLALDPKEARRRRALRKR